MRPLTSPPTVSVIIVNYNGLAFLQPCLDALHNAFLPHTHEVIVVDNASADGSQALLRQRTDIQYIELTTNTGFTGGNNVGAGAASGEILLLLNNDTRLESSLAPLIDKAREQGVGVAGCQLRYGDGRTQFSFGLEHSPWRLILSWLGLEKRHAMPSVFRRLETDASLYLRSHDNVPWVSGAVLATPRILWQQLGGFDERFFMYCEDVDYCRRARLRGLRVAYVAESLVTHFEGAGKAWIGPAALLRSTRSYVIYLQKHFGPAQTRMTCVGLGLVFGLRALVFKLQALTSSSQHRAGKQLKASGFGKACHSMLSAAMTGKTPNLP
ncbi:MAG: glycosyltransferase family 2 protein [Aquabacterium sp.]|nr:glycosyltransferase family 2 protein [Aquabacterium sp.]